MSRDDANLKRLAATHLMHLVGPMTSSIQARVVAQTGFSLIDNEALRIIEAADTPMRMTDIATGLIVSKAGATKVVDRLERQGLVRRERDAGDRRSYLVEIAAEGRAALDRIGPVVDTAIEELWSRHVSRAEAEKTLELADRVIDANPDWYA